MTQIWKKYSTYTRVDLYASIYGTSADQIGDFFKVPFNTRAFLLKFTHVI